MHSNKALNMIQLMHKMLSRSFHSEI